MRIGYGKNWRSTALRRGRVRRYSNDAPGARHDVHNNSSKPQVDPAIADNNPMRVSEPPSATDRSEESVETDLELEDARKPTQHRPKGRGNGEGAIYKRLEKRRRRDGTSFELERWCSSAS